MSSPRGFYNPFGAVNHQNDEEMDTEEESAEESHIGFGAEYDDDLEAYFDDDAVGYYEDDAPDEEINSEIPVPSFAPPVLSHRDPVVSSDPIDEESDDEEVGNQDVSGLGFDPSGDDLLDQLLNDEEDSVPVVRKESVSQSEAEGVTQEEKLEGAVKNDVITDNTVNHAPVPDRHDDTQSELEEVRSEISSSQESHVDLPEHKVEAVVETRRKVIKERLSEEEVSQGRVRTLPDERNTDPFVEVQVDQEGRQKGARRYDSRTVPKRESAHDEKMSTRRYRYDRGSGKVNEAELEFFKSLQMTKNSASRNPRIMDALRPPVDGVETPAQRKLRKIVQSQALQGVDVLSSGRRSTFNEKDIMVLQFLAMFRYATSSQVASLLGVKVISAENRLAKLKGHGLIMYQDFGVKSIFFPTEVGMLMSGYELPRISKSKIKISGFIHQFTVNHVAANLWSGGLDVLGLGEIEGFPSYNRVDTRGREVVGENLVSELEIISPFSRLRVANKSSVFRPMIMGQTDKAFADWEKSGGVDFGDSPELMRGNEYMWAIVPPNSLKLSYHLPDLVVKRPRNPDGSPGSIAVEVELNDKTVENYQRTMDAYRMDTRLFSRVVWICNSNTVANKVQEAAKSSGLWREGRISIMPVIHENGAMYTGNLMNL